MGASLQTFKESPTNRIKVNDMSLDLAIKKAWQSKRQWLSGSSKQSNDGEKR
jgi:hypothetical protein